MCTGKKKMEQEVGAESKWNFICNIVMCILAGIVFLSVLPMYTVDSVEYISYLDYFEGIRPVYEWSARRGFTFPILLWIGTQISYNSFGINIVLDFFWIIMIYFLLKILDIILAQIQASKILYVVKFALVIIFILVNPIVYGMFHFTLTEPISGALLCISIYVAIQFYIELDKDDTLSNKRWVIYICIWSFLTIFLWFLKQMFFTVTVTLLFALMVIFLGRGRFSKRRIYQLGGVIVGVILSLTIVIKTFNNIVNDEQGQNIMLLLVGGERYFEIEDYKMNDGNITLWKELKGNHKINIKDDNYETIESFEYVFDGTGMGYLKYVITCMFKAPNRFFKGYIDNYRLLCGLSERPYEDAGIRYQTGPVRNIGIKDILEENISSIDKTDKWNISNENRNSVYMFLENQYQSKSYMDSYNNLPFFTERMEYFKDSYKSLYAHKITMSGWGTFHFVLYTLLSLAMIPTFVISLVLVWLKRTINSRLLCFYLTSFFSCAHTLMLIMTGCVTDRYMFPVYIAQIIAVSIVVIIAVDAIQKLISKKNNKNRIKT